MEKRLSLTIDPKKAEEGAKKVSTLLKDLTKQADKLQKALDKKKELEVTLSKSTTKKNLKESLDSITLKKRVELYATKADATKSLQGTLNSLNLTAAVKFKSQGSVSAPTVSSNTTPSNPMGKSGITQLDFVGGSTQLDNYTYKLNQVFAVSDLVGKKTDQLNNEVTDLELAMRRATGAVDDNYNKLELYNTEVGKELLLTNEMVKARRKAITEVSKEAKLTDQLNEQTTENEAKLKMLSQGYYQHNANVKEAIRVEEKLATTRAKLSNINTDSARELKALEKQLKEVDDANEKVGKSSRNLQRSMMGVGIAASMFSGTMIIEDLLRTADAYTELQNKLVVVTGSTEGLTQATSDLVQVAFDSRTSLAATVDLYSKLNRVNKQYAYSQKEILTITETVSKAVAMSGASTAAAEGAVIQFAQALAGDFKTSGQELNSILEQTPGLSEALADGLSKVGNVGEVTSSQLKKLASEGLISTKDVMEGLIAVSDDIGSKFDLSLKTVTQSWQGLTDAFTVSLGKFDQANGITKTLSQSIDSLTQNLIDSQAAVGALAGLLTGGAFLAVGGTIAALATLVGGPIVLGVTAALTATTALGAAFASMDTDAERASKRLEEVTHKLRRFKDATVQAKQVTTELSEAVRDQRESLLLANITSIEAQLNNISPSQRGDGGALDSLKKQRDYLTDILNLQEDSSQVVATDALINKLRSEEAAYKALTDQLTVYKNLLKDLRIENAESTLTDYLGGTVDNKKLESYNQTIENVNRAVTLGGTNFELYGRVVKKALEEFNKTDETTKSVKDLNTAFDDYIASLQNQLNLIGESELSTARYNSKLKAKAAYEKQYGEQLEDGTITLSDYNKGEKEAIRLAEQKTEAIYKQKQALKETQDILKGFEDTSGYLSSVTGGLSQQIEEINRAVNAGILADNKNTLDYLDKLKTSLQKAKDQVNSDWDFTGLTELQNKLAEIDRTLGADSEEAKKAKAMAYTAFFSGFRDGLADAIATGDYSGIGAGIASAISSSIGTGVSQSITKSLGGGLLSGALGAVGGGVVSGLVGGILSGSKTTLKGEGYRIGIESGELFSAELSKSFKRSSFLGSKSWTEYTKLSIAEFDSLANSITESSESMTVAAKSLGGSVSTFTGVLSNKDGSLADGIEEYTNKTAEQSFAAIEKFKEVGETFEETFIKLGNIAKNVNESLRLTGADVLVNRDSQIQSRAAELKSQYEKAYQDAIDTEFNVASQIVSRAITGDKFNQEFISSIRPMLEKGLAEGLRLGDIVTMIGAGETELTEGMDISGLASVYSSIRKNFKDLAAAVENSDEILSRIGDTLKESVAEYNNRLITSLAEIENISKEDAQSLLSSLSQSFAENYLTEQERLKNSIANAKFDFISLGFSESDLSASKEQVKAFYEQVSSPEERARVLAAADALVQYNKTLEEQEVLLKKQKELLEGQLNDNTNALIVNLSNLIDAEVITIENSFSSIFTSLTEGINSSEEAISKLNNAVSAIKSAIESVSLQSTSLSVSRRSAALTRLDNVLVDARAGGSVDSDVISSISSALSSPDMSTFTSYLDYAREQSRALNSLYELDSITGDQLSIEEKTLKELEGNKLIQEELMNSQIKTLEDQLTEAKKQSDWLQGINTGFGDLSSVIKALQEQSGVVVGSTGGQVSDSEIKAYIQKAFTTFGTNSQGALSEQGSRYLYNLASQYGIDTNRIDSLLSGSLNWVNDRDLPSTGSGITHDKPAVSDADIQWTINDAIERFGANDQAWMYLYNRAKSFGISTDRIDKFLDGTNEWIDSQGLPKIHGSHAEGADNIPYDNYVANLHKGEMVLTAPVADLIRNSVGDNQMVELIRELIGVIKSDSYNTNRKLSYLQPMFEILDKFDNDGLPPERT